MDRSWRASWTGIAAACAALIVFAPASVSAWDCRIEVDKTVAPDDDCDGVADGAFTDSVSQDIEECVVYRICVSNTSDAASGQLIRDIDLCDSKLDPSCIPLSLQLGETKCVDYRGLWRPEGPGTLVCSAIEGINAVDVLGAICEPDGVKACDRDGSICQDTAEVACLDNGCLTRTPGFWGQHPDVTQEFLAVNSCGLTLSEAVAGIQGSVTEDLCSLGTDKKLYGSPQEGQLVRQCAAAALNMAASVRFNGSCAQALTPARFNECCGTAAACAAATDGCISDVTAFNESYDSMRDPLGNELSLCHELAVSCDADPLQFAMDNNFINTR